MDMRAPPVPAPATKVLYVTYVHTATRQNAMHLRTFKRERLETKGENWENLTKLLRRRRNLN